MTIQLFLRLIHLILLISQFVEYNIETSHSEKDYLHLNMQVEYCLKMSHLAKIYEHSMFWGHIALYHVLPAQHSNTDNSLTRKIIISPKPRVLNKKTEPTTVRFFHLVLLLLGGLPSPVYDTFSSGKWRQQRDLPPRTAGGMKGATMCQGARAEPARAIQMFLLLLLLSVQHSATKSDHKSTQASQQW